MLIVVLCLAQIIHGRAKRYIPLSFGLLWFAAALAPATGIFYPINALISDDPAPPLGGAVFHDTAVWLRAAAAELPLAAE